MKLSVVVITRNEEANIGRCLDSVTWADERIVYDHGSTDSTVALARERGATVYSGEWIGFGPAKQRAIGRASGDWILSLDADEEVTPDLAGQIKEILAGNSPHAAFALRRRNLFLGKWISHAGWYPDHTIRLFRAGMGKFDSAIVHESVEITGTIGRLSGDLRHYNYPTLNAYLAKSELYTTLGAEKAHAQGRRAGMFDLTVRPVVSFISHYIVKQGFRDGYEGFLLSALSAHAVLVKYAKLRELTRHDRL